MTDPRTRDDLLAAMSQAACPLCVLLERAERKAVDMFLYDQVNDISRRDALRASRGLCLNHSSMLAEGVNPMAVAGHLGDTLETLQRVYAHWMRDDRDVPADALDRILRTENAKSCGPDADQTALRS